MQLLEVMRRVHHKHSLYFSEHFQLYLLVYDSNDNSENCFGHGWSYRHNKPPLHAGRTMSHHRLTESNPNIGRIEQSGLQLNLSRQFTSILDADARLDLRWRCRNNFPNLRHDELTTCVLSNISVFVRMY